MVEVLDPEHAAHTSMELAIGQEVRVSHIVDGRTRNKIGLVVREETDEIPGIVILPDGSPDGCVVLTTELNGFVDLPQGPYFGKPTYVSLDLKSPKTESGIVVRQDALGPYAMVIRLKDGRYVFDHECHYTPPLWQNRIMATYSDFEKLDIRVGKIIKVDDLPEARNPSYKLQIDFGKDIGVKKSCAQLPANYSKKELHNRLILAIVNFPPRQIGPAISEVLTLGVPDSDGNCILIEPDKDVPLGGSLY